MFGEPKASSDKRKGMIKDMQSKHRSEKKGAKVRGLKTKALEDKKEQKTDFKKP